MSEENQSHLIARLILRVRFEVASDDERRQLDSWLRQSPERRQLYERVLSGESWREYTGLCDDFDRTADYRRLQADILRSIRRRNRGRRLRRYVGWTAAAAVVLVGVLAVARLRHEPAVEPSRPPVAQAVPAPAPVDDKVVLVLSDGKQIGMSHVADDTLQVGRNVVAEAGEKTLRYDSASVAGEEAPLEMNKVLTATGGFYTLVLSDGTRVWLNSESELEFPVAFGRGEREVRLRGEAFFEVARDSARPFYVVAGDVRTRVLGTSFNVKAYANEPAVTATLFTGKIEVAPLKDLARRVVLSPGRQAAWDGRGGEMTVADADLRHVAAWKNGMFIFNGENIDAITRQIERWYGVRFVYQIPDKDNYTFNGYFSRYDSLRVILDEFTYMGGPEFQIKQDTVYVTERTKNKMEPLGN